MRNEIEILLKNLRQGADTCEEIERASLYSGGRDFARGKAKAYRNTIEEIERLLAKENQMTNKIFQAFIEIQDGEFRYNKYEWIVAPSYKEAHVLAENYTKDYYNDSVLVDGWYQEKNGYRMCRLWSLDRENYINAISAAGGHKIKLTIEQENK